MKTRIQLAGLNVERRKNGAHPQAEYSSNSEDDSEPSGTGNLYLVPLKNVCLTSTGFILTSSPTERNHTAAMSNPEYARWFTEEVQPHEPMLRAYLQKEFPALPDLDDVVQESHLRLIKARERGGIVSAKSYLFAIARNVALGVFRRNRKFPSVSVNELPESQLLEGDADAAETASCNQEIALATSAIDTLPPRCREIVMLSALRGLGHKEIAAQLGLAEDTVRVQVARGMKKCAQYLRDRGVRRPGQP